jgi:hypothetical protein
MNAALHLSYDHLTAHPRGFEVEAARQSRVVRLARRDERRARVRRLLAR